MRVKMYDGTSTNTILLEIGLAFATGLCDKIFGFGVDVLFPMTPVYSMFNSVERNYRGEGADFIGNFVRQEIFR